ncbi:hypothetical protein GCM10010168_16570 [Actinoplanes ianthinogenes]|uniref:Single-stranded DNA-binding protein n=1 Tax=Actinoplanes ianthinogenes TaxID=122358 RepID=A0ABN6CJ70_9ACTN|nr:single-stranded DNA-binding protein [Actinoplanes ianthinogenes]BCJ44844.1 hypothetical protein Aiant_55010 [Actinoplanes ianthinogenes]GGR00331.1 hypothetical protein GCM10010168_16570 [Actinoplanes ianthinogenes]
MFDTHIVVVGNVLTKPEWRRTTNSNQLVANFRLASTARRYDRENRCWVDGNTLRVRVSAWRKLAENVGSSINVGDPVIVFGRLYTRDWQDEEANHRVSYEMEALAVGHDLARGRSRFYRARPAGTSTVEDTEADTVIDGEPAEPVADGETPVRYGDGLPELIPGEVEPAFLEVVAELAEESAEEETVEAPRSRRTKKEPVAA